MRKTWVYIILSVMALVFVLRELDYIKSKSATYDEAYFISMGWTTLKTGDYRLRKDKTFLVPFITGIPLVCSKLNFPVKENIFWKQAEQKRSSWEYSLDFLYKNSMKSGNILTPARSSIIFVSLVLIAFIFIWTKELSESIYAALFSVYLFTFSAETLAHSGLATEDLGVACFSLITLYLFWKYTETNKEIYIIFTGIALSLALNSKHSALFLIPVLALLYLINIKTLRFKTSHLILFLLALAIPFLLIYRVVNIKEYFLSLKETVSYVNRSQAGFLMGKYSLKGFREYFLVSFLIKTQLSLIMLLVISLFVIRKNVKAGLFLLLPVVILLVTASFTPMQIGHRHILPIYPFIFVFTAYNITEIMKKKNIFLSLLIIACGLHYGITSVRIHPHYLAYFNETIGGPANGYKYLVDSNVDWGQDLKGLNDYVKKNNVSDVILSYYGSGLADSAGFKFQDLYSFGMWGEKAQINSEKPEKEIFAISVTNLQGLYLGRIGYNIFYWLKDKKPDTTIGYSIFIYDITEDAYFHERLANIYFYTGQGKAAFREAKRAVLLDLDSALSHLILSSIVSETSSREAISEMKRVLKIDRKLEFLYRDVIINVAGREAYLFYFKRMREICQKSGYKEGFNTCNEWIDRLGQAGNR